MDFAPAFYNLILNWQEIPSAAANSKDISGVRTRRRVEFFSLIFPDQG
jgi:hypothetical protein